MDQCIFQQLDRLERGARIETRPPQEMFNNSSAEFAAYDGPDQYHDQGHVYEPAYQHERDEYVDLPMVLDSFGKHPSA